jgi:hypothetical protein
VDTFRVGVTSVKIALLSVCMMIGIAFWGAGIYAADAASGHAVVDGYGVTYASR